MLSSEFLRILRCPYEQSSLEPEGTDHLRCADGHWFPVIQDVPVLLRSDTEATLWVAKASLEAAEAWVDGRDRRDPYFVQTLGLSDEERTEISTRLAQFSGEGEVDPVISFMVGATSGILYKNVIGKLSSVPVPVLPIEKNGGGAQLLDVGCNWGRWSIAAAQKGFSSVGIDPSLGGVLTAKRLAAKIGVSCQFVCGDGRFLPFASNVFAQAFSYSVIQHLSEQDAVACLKEIQRVLEPGGHSLIQMPNCFGIRSFYHLARRRFKKATHFDVRYWTPSQLLREFERAIGPSSLTIDGFLGLGVQASDRGMLPFTSRVVVDTSEFLKGVSRFVPPLKNFADSLYVESILKST